MQSILASIAVLGIVALFAVRFTTRRTVTSDPGRLKRVAVFAAAITLVQALHFTEEYATGFQIRFPELLGIQPYPPGFFVTFNVAWLLIWAVSIAGLARRARFAFFVFWFLGLASVMNAVAHPAMALATGGYFPGLYSSPLCGIAGGMLLVSLTRATAIWQNAGN